MSAAITAPVLDLMDASVGPAESRTAPSLTAVDWSAAPGDYWVLAGLAGSGKSDLLGTVAAFQRPRAGRWMVLGHDLVRLDEPGLVRLRQRIGFVFADGGRLFGNLTLAENIALPLAYHGNRDLPEIITEIEALLAEMELTDFAGLFPGQVGRAWRQRAALARALVLKSELLLVENPVSGFDSRHTRWWLQFLEKLNAGHPWLDGRPLTIVVSVEDLHPWSASGRQFAVIREGRMQTFRSRAELTASDDVSLREWLGTPTTV